jgi:biopolymer transport protein TolQ
MTNMNNTVTDTMLAKVQGGAAVASSGQGLDMWSLVWSGDLVVKSVVLLLLAASLWSLAVIAQKYSLIRLLNSRSNKFEDAFWSGESLEKLYERVQNNLNDPMSAVFAVGMKEWRRGQKKRQPGAPHAGMMQRIERVMAVAIGREMGRIERYMTFLASAASVGPLLGLFGTVWGVIEAFTAIGMAGNTSIGAIAPGMASALTTTALGMIVAIPASVAYNKFTNDINRYGDRLEAFAAEFSSILARYLDETAH